MYKNVIFMAVYIWNQVASFSKINILSNDSTFKLDLELCVLLHATTFRLPEQ